MNDEHVEQWLAVPDRPSGNGGPTERRVKRSRGRNPRERWLATRLRRAKQKLRAQEELIEELRARVAELEAKRR
jgi:hypothetical protein